MSENGEVVGYIVCKRERTPDDNEHALLRGTIGLKPSPSPTVYYVTSKEAIPGIIWCLDILFPEWQFQHHPPPEARLLFAAALVALAKDAIEKVRG